MQSYSFNPLTKVTILVILLILVGVGGYYIGNNYSAESTNTDMVTTNTIQPKEKLGNSTDNPTKTNTASGLTADWKTYSNDRYNYSIKYPSNWFVDTTHSEDDFTSRGEDKELIGGDTMVSNFSKPGDYDADNVPSDLQVVSLMVYKVDPSISYDSFMSTPTRTFMGNKESIKFDGLDAIKISGNTKQMNDAPSNAVIILVKDGQNMFVLNYNIPAQGSNSDTLNTLEGVVNSFKLVK